MGTLGVTSEKPPNTPLYAHYYTAPSNAKVEPPKIQAAVDKSFTKISPVPSVEPASSASVACGPDLQTLVMTQLVQIQQMQMVQNMLRYGGPAVAGQGTNPIAPLFIQGLNTANSHTGVQGSGMEFSEFFEHIRSSSSGPFKRDLDKMMTQLNSAGIYQISELELFSDKELVDDVGMLLGDAKWLRLEVRKALGLYSQ